MMARSRISDALRQMIKRLYAINDWSMSYTQDYVADRVSVSVALLQTWLNPNKTNHPNSDQLEQLVTIGVSEAQMDRRWAEHVLFHERHPDRMEILGRLFPTTNIAGLPHNLHNRPYLFVDRDQEIRLIEERLAPESRHWIIPLEGMGGIGKSALALEVAWRQVDRYQSLTPGRRFEAIIWVSAKHETLTIKQGLNRRQPTFTNLEDIYKAIARVLEAPRILQVSDDEQSFEVENVLRKGGRVLFVIDNLEEVDDPFVLTFLDNLPGSAKAIVTTREHADIHGSPIRLEPLTDHWAVELIAHECADKHIKLPEDQIRQLIEVTGRMPLALHWVIGLIAEMGYSVDGIIKRFMDRREDLLRFIFESVIERLATQDMSAYHTLLAFSLFDNSLGAAPHVLANVLGFGEETCRMNLARLLNLNLIIRSTDGERFTILPLTSRYVTTERETVPNWEPGIRERWVTVYLQLVNPRIKSNSFDHLQPELANIQVIISWLLAQERWTDVIRMFQGVQGFLYSAGYWEILLTNAEILTQWGLQQHRADVVTLTLHTPINIFRRRGEYTRGNRWLEQAKLLAAQTDDLLLTAEILFSQRYMTDVYHLAMDIQQECGEELSDLYQALHLYEQIKPSGTIKTYNLIGNCHRRWNQYPEALNAYKAGIRRLKQLAETPAELEELNVDTWNAILNGNIALILGAQQMYAEARAIMIGILPKLTDQTDQAEAIAALALYDYHLGHVKQAKLFRKKVDEIKTKLSLKYPVCEEDAIWLSSNISTCADQ